MSEGFEELLGLTIKSNCNNELGASCYGIKKKRGVASLRSYDDHKDTDEADADRSMRERGWE